MLNISAKSIDKFIDKSKYSIFKKLEERSVSNVLLRVMTVVLVVCVLALFLPWTQNIRTDGYVTTLNPYDKPQAIQSLIDGKIQQWQVVEGDIVSIGDTILVISESKEDYLDPNLMNQTQGQIDAKKSSSSAYQEKANVLDNQYDATLKNKSLALEQNQIKLKQTLIKIKTDSLDLAAAKIKAANSNNQKIRTEELYKQGIKSLTDLEKKTLSYSEALAKVNSLENKIQNNQNDISQLENNRAIIENDYAQKLAKIRSDKMSAISMKYSTNSDINKLESSFNKFKARSDAYYITSPINGTITKIIKQGIGEYIKAGEDLTTIIPTEFTKAAMVYVRPRDIPLLKIGQKTRIQFDGWPAIIFSGWPENSFGTFEGRIYAIDNDVSNEKAGTYRIIITEDQEKTPWPQQIRIGGGVKGLILLNEVSVYYEIWRQLNGFPPDFYDNKMVKKVKTKAPMKKIK